MLRLLIKYIAVCLGCYLATVFFVMSFCPLVSKGEFVFEKSIESEEINDNDSISNKVYSLDELNRWIDRNDSLKTCQIENSHVADFHSDIDSVVELLYQEGKLNESYSQMIKFCRSFSSQYPEDWLERVGSDTLFILKRFITQFYTFDYRETLERNRMLREALIPLNYTEQIYAGPALLYNGWQTEYSDRKLYFTLLIGYILHGLVRNPIMFICLPVGICFLIFSRKARGDFKLFLRNVCQRIRSRVDRIKRK